MVTCWPSATSSMPDGHRAGRPGRPAPAGDLRLGRVQHRLGHRAGAAELRLHPGDQRGHQVRLPRRPGRRAGRRAVGLGEGVQQLQHGGVAADRRRRPGRWSPGRRCRGGWRWPAAAGGGAPARRASATSGAREAHPGGDLRRDRLPDHAVVARPALADVVQQRADQQQVGPVDVAGQLGGGGRGLDQVPVDGEPVPRVALRQRAHPVPLRAAAGTAGPPGPAARAPATAARPLASSRRNDQRTSGGHGSGSGGLCTASTLSVYGREQQVRPRRGGRGAQQQAGIGGRAGVAGEHHLVALAHHALGQRLAAHPPVAAARPARPGRPRPGARSRRRRRPAAGRPG